MPTQILSDMNKQNSSSYIVIQTNSHLIKRFSKPMVILRIRFIPSVDKKDSFHCFHRYFSTALDRCNAGGTTVEPTGLGAHGASGAGGTTTALQRSCHLWKDLKKWECFSFFSGHALILFLEISKFIQKGRYQSMRCDWLWVLWILFCQHVCQTFENRGVAHLSSI